MSNVKKYTDKLDQLKFDEMYNGDFFLKFFMKLPSGIIDVCMSFNSKHFQRN